MQSSDDYLGDTPLLPFCQRCLARDHYRAQCHSPIRCLACRRWGHTAALCDFHSASAPGFLTEGGKGRRQFTDLGKKMAAGWSDNAVVGPSRAGPIVSDENPQAAPSLSAWAARGNEPEVNVLRHPKPSTVQSLAPSNDPLSLSLGSSPSSALLSRPVETPLCYSLPR